MFATLELVIPEHIEKLFYLCRKKSDDDHSPTKSQEGLVDDKNSSENNNLIEKMEQIKLAKEDACELGRASISSQL